jgi:hypothetical protein
MEKRVFPIKTMNQFVSSIKANFSKNIAMAGVENFFSTKLYNLSGGKWQFIKPRSSLVFFTETSYPIMPCTKSTNPL